MTEPTAPGSTGPENNPAPMPERSEIDREHRVVVGFDGSPASKAAVVWAAEEAALRKVPLRITHAYYPSVEGDLMPEDVHRNVVRTALDTARDEARRVAPDVELDLHELHRWAPDALIEESRSADLVVLGSRGHGDFASLLVGSTSLQVAMHAECPVVVVRPGRETAAPTPQPGPVVVGVDGSKLSSAALTFAAHEASLRKVPLITLHTWSLQYLGTPFVYEPMSKDWETLEASQRQLLSDITSEVREKYPDVEVIEHLRRGHPVEELVKASEDAALVVVGSRGRRSLTALLLGSVSHGVLHHAHCPVAIVRPLGVRR